MITPCPPLVTLPAASCILRTTCITLRTHADWETDPVRRDLVNMERDVSILYDVLYNGMGHPNVTMQDTVGRLRTSLQVDDVEAAKQSEKTLKADLRARGIDGEPRDSLLTAIYSLRQHLKLLRAAMDQSLSEK